jgi:EAL domain-containing protein (putative c-di-GMP-specific phosphodiesterase class I)
MTSFIYVIDDDPQAGQLMKFAMSPFGLETRTFDSATEFLKCTTTANDIILLDLSMPDVDGIQVIRLLAERGCQSTLFLISGHDTGILHSAEQLALAHNLNVAPSQQKPIRIAHLQECIQEVIDSISSGGGNHHTQDTTPSEHELRDAIAQQQLELYYQPKINLYHNTLSGVEALIRWPHPERGMILPDQFIPLAESSGLIDQLTSEVINQASKQHQRWQMQGFTTPIAINVSPINITNQNLVQQLLIRDHNHASLESMLTIELTESAVMGELLSSLEVLTRLRMRGFNLSIDDFGTGYSSLSQLHRIPFTELKIDRDFVIGMDRDKEALAIVKTCIMLGHELNMNVIAEGVETQKSMNTLIELGCDIAQGYHIAKPMPAEDLQQWSNSYFNKVHKVNTNAELEQSVSN